MSGTSPTVGNVYSPQEQAKTDNPNIVLFPPKLLQTINAYLLMIVVPMWLIVPAIILFEYTSNKNRAIIYSIFTLATSWSVKFVATFSKYKFMVAIITQVFIFCVLVTVTDQSQIRCSSGCLLIRKCWLLSLRCRPKSDELIQNICYLILLKLSLQPCKHFIPDHSLILPVFKPSPAPSF